MVVLVVLAAFVAVEIVVMIEVAHAIGVIATLLALIAFGAGGAWVVTHEGLSTWRGIKEDLRSGRIPTGGLVDGFLVVCSGTLLLLPGFVSDVIGVLLLVRPVRNRVGRSAMGSIERRVSKRVRVVGERLRPGQGYGSGRGATYEATFEERFDAWPGADERPAAHDGDVIDLDAEEYFLGESVAELDPPREADR